MSDPFAGLRLLRPVRNQVDMFPGHLDSVVPADHPVRAMWSLISKFDLSLYLERIKSWAGHAGRPAIDPQVLLGLWVFAHFENVGSAYELALRCERDVVYRWILGGIAVDRKTLSNFRTAHRKTVDKLLTKLIAMLMRAGVIEIDRLAEDGVKVRACAGADSFRRRESLEKCLANARNLVEQLSKDIEKNDGGQAQAALKRAAAERKAALEKALEELQAVEEVREVEAERNKARAEKRKEPRVSTTDPEARVMKMADGGFRPSYNVQFAEETAAGFIVGVHVSNEGTDARQLEPTLGDVVARTGELPREMLVDGGYATHANIEGLAEHGITTYAPVPEPKNKETDKHAPKPTDSEVVAEWRTRMKSDEAKELYKQRAATSERTNAEMRTRRGLARFTVRGLEKVTTVTLLAALAYNVFKCIGLGYF